MFVHEVDERKEGRVEEKKMEVEERPCKGKSK